MEIFLSREISSCRIYPAVDIAKSGTRKEELLLEPGELKQIRGLRRVLAGLGTVEAAKTLVEQLQAHPSNQELLDALKPEK